MNIDFSDAERGPDVLYFCKDLQFNSVNPSLLTTVIGKSDLKIAIIPQSSFGVLAVLIF